MPYARGYDVSDYQSVIPQDAEFVFIKVSEGARTGQTHWRAKQADARKRGLVVGYYHFFHTDNAVADEVAHFCTTVGDVPEDELLVLDFEPYDQGVSDSAATVKKNAWLAAVKARYPRHRVGVYTNRDWWFRTDDNAGDFLWIADYEAAAGSPRIQAAWRFHQHTDRPLDTNVYAGSADELRAWVGGTAAAQVSARVPPPRVTRAELGWPASAAAGISQKQAGSKVHYLGTSYSFSAHTHCAGYVRSLRESHLANTVENYSDIAYNEIVCEHGVRFEGRGYNKRTGANGNASLNATHYAICALLGSEGSTEPTAEQLHGLRDAIEAYRQYGGAGPEIRGHRDGYATSCPGGPLYAWVQAGAPRPSAPGQGPGAAPDLEEEMKVLGGELRAGFDPIGNLVIPPSVPNGRSMFVNIGADMGLVRGRVDAFVTGQGWRRLGEFTVDQNSDLAFYPLPPGTRKVNIKRLPGEGIRPDTPAAWNVEVV
jgi:hypothetical protein